MPDATLPVLADTITKPGPQAQGNVVVTGSHGGIYAAYLARQSGCRAVIFNDAGTGLDQAGVGGLGWLDPQGMAAAAVDHASANIGNAAQMLQAGRISFVNACAAALGVDPGMSCAQAARLLLSAPLPDGPCPQISEGREVLSSDGAVRALVVVDSAGLVIPQDADAVIVTGSHGALFGADPANALKAEAHLALFNDAGGGIGCSRLPALEGRGIAAATVSAATARIGDGRSTWQDGRISAANAGACALGARIGMRAADLIATALAS